MREMPPGVLMVGAATWDPPEPLPDSIPDDDRPLVLVACSSEFQDDAAIAAAAIEGLAGDHRVVVTTAGVDPADLPRRGDAAVERHLRHSPLLERASVLVCHGGMGGTQKALAMGVPVCVVPWARDADRHSHAGACKGLPPTILPSPSRSGVHDHVAG
jgi:UDP:flavonoid glycosyltransferase YjiC (YdhE family)